MSGAAFVAAEVIAAKAPRGSVWASHVLVDLVPGSDLHFEATGEHLPLKGREIGVFSVDVES